MISKWTSHLQTQEERDKFVREIQGSKKVLERQREIMDEMEKDLGRAETDPKNYGVPNWDYRQAHSNGFRQCLNLLQILTNLDLKENNDPR